MKKQFLIVMEIRESMCVCERESGIFKRVREKKKEAITGICVLRKTKRER